MKLTTASAVCPVKKVGAEREALSENKTVRGAGVRSRRAEKIIEGYKRARKDGLATNTK